MGKYAPTILICLFVFLSGCITTGPDRLAILEQHIVEAEKKIAKLENTVETDIEAGMAKKSDQEMLQERFAQTRVRLDELDARIQSLNGKIEEMNFIIDGKITYQESKREKIEEIIAVNEHRIAKLEEYLNLEKTGGNKTTKPTGQGKASSPEEVGEEALYAQAKEAFDKGNLEYARVQFQKFLERYPKSNNADNAQFWIAEIYYVEKWYEKSVLEYQKVIENYPKGNKIPAALLKQGFAFMNMDDKANARIILNELVNKYPKSPEADAARAKLQKL